MTNKKLPPRLSNEEMTKLAVTTVQNYVNACNCKSRDDILLALSHLLSTGLSAGDAVKYGRAEIVQ